MTNTATEQDEPSYPGIAWEAELDHFVDYAVHCALAQAWSRRMPDDADARAAADTATKHSRRLLDRLVSAVCDPDTAPPTEDGIRARAAQDVITRLAAHVVQERPPKVPPGQLETGA